MDNSEDKVAMLVGGTLAIISDYDENNNLHLAFQGGGGLKEGSALYEDKKLIVKKIHYDFNNHIIEFK